MQLLTTILLVLKTKINDNIKWIEDDTKQYAYERNWCQIRESRLEANLYLALPSTSLPAPLMHIVREHLAREIMFRTMLYERLWAENTHTPW